MKLIFQKILAVLARAVIRKYKPLIIGVTGSVGKTSARLAIFSVVQKKYRAATAEKNFNNEIGLPLAILGMPHCGRSVLRWKWELLKVLWRLFVRRDGAYPEALVLEYAVDRPGDMDYLLSLAKPNVGVVTAIGDVPVHVEFFQGPKEVIAEKTKLIAALPKDGIAILNHDDLAVYGMKEKACGAVYTYGREPHATIRFTPPEVRIGMDAKLSKIPDGISFTLMCGGNSAPVYLKAAFGLPSVYAAAAAAAVGVALGMDIAEVADVLGRYAPPPGRMRLLLGIKHSFILDDTYNAAPESMRAALETLRDLPAKRRIAVLGDMLEIGKYTEQAHRAIGDLASNIADMIITVGPRAKFIADEALTHGIERGVRLLDKDHVLCFDDALSAGKALDSYVREGDLVLVKGSRGMRMERVVFEIMKEAHRAGELLVHG